MGNCASFGHGRGKIKFFIKHRTRRRSYLGDGQWGTVMAGVILWLTGDSWWHRTPESSPSLRKGQEQIGGLNDLLSHCVSWQAAVLELRIAWGLRENRDLPALTGKHRLTLAWCGEGGVGTQTSLHMCVHSLVARIKMNVKRWWNCQPLAVCSGCRLEWQI